jgi:hypothetical protein
MTPHALTLVWTLGALVDLGGMATGLINDAQAALDAVTVPIGLISVTWILLSTMPKAAVGRAELGDLWAIKIPLVALFLLGFANYLVDAAYDAGNQGSATPAAVESSEDDG